MPNLRYRGSVVLLITIALVGAACGDDAGPLFTSAPTSAPTTAPPSTAVSTSNGGTFQVSLDGVGWQVPEVACDAESDPTRVAAAAAATSARVQALVRDRAAGWPTTIVASADDDVAFLEIELLGPLALALAQMSGSPESTIEVWADFEAGYADADGGWGPVTEISTRVPSWLAIAERLVVEIETACLIDAAEVPSATEASNADLRFIDGGALGSMGTVRVQVEPGDLSILAHARTGTADDLVFVTAVLDPDGADVGDAIGLEYGELTNSGEAAVFLPIRDDVDLRPGEYRITFEATAPIVESGALVKSGDPDAKQAVDVVFWMATTVIYDRAELEQRFRSVGTQMFANYGIAIGSITFVDPPAGVIDRFSVLEFFDDSDSDLRGLCREMTSAIGEVRAINFAIVDRLDDGDPDAVIEGSSSGLPGTALLAGSDLGCVAGMAAVDPDFGDRDLLDRAVVVWHEAGHHLGLYHTSEGDGLYFDLIDDTPQCRIEDRDDNGDGLIDSFECAGLDADNFMFFDGDGLEVTPDQAWMIRRHPLLYPVG